MFICRQKNPLHHSRFPWDNAKILQTCYCGYFEHAWLCTPKVIRSTCRKLSCLSTSKKLTSPPSFFLRYLLQRYVNFLFWVLWVCLSTHFQNNSITSSFAFFLRYYILKNPAIWLANSILTHNLRTRILPDLGLVMKYQLQY